MGTSKLVYEDTRYFGRLTLDTSAVTRLGPEPLDDEFKAETFAQSLKRSRQAIKVKLLDQKTRRRHWKYLRERSAVPRAHFAEAGGEQTDRAQVRRLRLAIRAVLAEAIECGSTVPLNLGGDKSDGFFILAVRRERRIFTRNACGFMTAKDNPARIAAIRSNASPKPHEARFIVRIASAHDEAVYA